MVLIDRLGYRTTQWLVAVFALLHNLEEAITMGRYAPLVRHRLSGLAPSGYLAATEHLSWFFEGLIVATIIPMLAVIVAVRNPANRFAAWAVVLVQTVFLMNVIIPHVPAALLLGGYAPGVVTAVAIELPFSIYFLRRSLREGVISRSGAAWALVLAGPALVTVLGVLYWSVL